jgi:ATP phosphoribosyltransferase
VRGLVEGAIEKKTAIKIAIQKNGHLGKESLALLKACGFEFPPQSRKLNDASTTRSEVEVVYMRHSEIPRLVAEGLVDFGIVGEDLLIENGATDFDAVPLGFGNTTLVIAVPEESPIRSLEDLRAARFATSFPNILGTFLASSGIEPRDVDVWDGGIEVLPALGRADAICDIVQTGNTLSANGLRVIAVVENFTATLISQK